MFSNPVSRHRTCASNLKVSNEMTKSKMKLKSSKPLTAVFGFGLYLDKTILSAGNYVRLDAGWIELSVGIDDSSSEFISAATMWENFQFTANPPPSTCSSRSRINCRQWVYHVTADPAEYLASSMPPVEIECGGFRISYGVDSSRRQFLYVVYPGTRHIFLFRNPKSRSVLPWSPSGAQEIMDGMVAPSPEVVRARTAIAAVTYSDKDFEDFFAGLDA